jgi:hypothetical protein
MTLANARRPQAIAARTSQPRRSRPTPRSYRDRKDYAMEAAQLIKSKNPHSMELP